MNDTKTKNFNLYLDEFGLPESFVFDNGFEWGVGENDNDRIGKTQSELLALLALYTAYRKTPPNDEVVSAPPPDLLNYHPNFARKLSEAAGNNKNFAAGKSTTHWLERIFGEPPNGIYLVANRGSGNIYFSNKVCISITPVNQGKLTATDLLDSLTRHTQAMTGLPKNIEIQIATRQNGENLGLVISNQTRLASLETGTRFSLRLTPNYQTALAVFWINSDASVDCLHPDSPWGRISGPIPGKKGPGIAISEDIPLKIDPPQGSEICLVLASDKKKLDDRLEDIENEIVDVLDNWNPHPSNIPENVRIEKRSLRKPRAIDQGEQPLAMNQGKNRVSRDDEDEFDDLLKNLVRSFRSKATTLYLLQIPHR